MHDIRNLAPSLLLVGSLCASGVAHAQDQDTAEKSSLIRYVENQLSTPDRRISLNGIQGTLSSNVSFDSITIADRQGVWLTIVHPQLQWSRAALLTGRLEIDSLTADRIEWPRMAASEGSASPEATEFALPDLPVSVNIDRISVAEAHFGRPVFGLESTLSIDGHLSLGGGELATHLDVQRVDGPGGQMALDASYSNATTQLGLDLKVEEPQNGVVANLLDIPDRPPVSLTLSGAGPLDGLDADLAFDVAGKRIATGRFTLHDGTLSSDRRADLRLSGPIAEILPPEHRAFFGSETSLSAEMILRAKGGGDLRAFRIDSGPLQVTATGATLDDWFPREIKLDASLHSAAGPVRLPVSGDPVTIGDGSLALRYGEQGWTLSGALDRVATASADISAIQLDGSGAIQNINAPDRRALNFALKSTAKGVAPHDAAIAKATGDEISFSAAGGWSAGSPVRIDRSSIDGKTMHVDASGTVKGLAFNGKAHIEAADLAAFSLVAGRALAGSAALDVDGDLALAGGAFDVMLDGSLTDARFDDATLDKLLDGETQLTGGVARSADGLAFRNLTLANPQARIFLNGRYATREADLRARAEIPDIARIDNRGSGQLTLDATIDKAQDLPLDTPFAVKARIGLDAARLAGQAVPQAAFLFDGRIDSDSLAGTISGDGSIGGQTIDVAGQLSRGGDALSLSGLSVRVGGNRLSGDVSLVNGLANGALAIDAPDISPLAALALTDATGSIKGDIKLSSAAGRQDAVTNLAISNVRYGDNRIAGATVDATLSDLFGSPRVDASVDGRTLHVGGVTVTSLSVTSRTEGENTRFAADATLDNGTKARAEGTMRPTSDGGFAATVETLSAQSSYGNLRLTAPARIVHAAGSTRFDGVEADVAGGRLRASGVIGDGLEIRANVSALPLSIANSVRPDLGLGGTLDGTIETSGAASDPVVSFDIAMNGLNAAALREASISPITVGASGSWRNGVVQLNRATAKNAQDLDFSASGAVPLSGPGLSLRVAGNAPLALAERFLAERGTRLSGALRVDATLTGSLTSPNAEGLFSLSGANVSDPLSNLKLTDIGGVAGLRGDTISISKLSVKLNGGGSVAVSGTVGLSGTLPADLAITLSNAVYSDGEMVRTSLSGKLAVTGPLTAGPLVSGTIDLNGTEITVPETIGSEADLLDVRHIDPDGGTLRTLRRIEAVLPKEKNAAPQAPVRLDLTISSPNRVFVRGRGIDAELGGRLRLTGSLDALRPVGAFNLIRGRLSILNKRLDLTEGQITLTGSLDPQIKLIATVEGNDIVGKIQLSGRASDLSLDLSSSPELPQDEILARILFGKSISSLSPLQIASLATAVASLANGGGGASLSEQIRRGVGVDDLDVVQDAEGNVALKAGKYIQDNIYLDIQANQSGGEVSVNLDITNSLTAKGTVDSGGESKLGIFFEKDY